MIFPVKTIGRQDLGAKIDIKRLNPKMTFPLRSGGCKGLGKKLISLFLKWFFPFKHGRKKPRNKISPDKARTR